MPSRKIPFVNGQYYHVYNRGTEKRVIFQDRWDYNHFLKVMEYYHFAGPKPKFSDFSEQSMPLTSTEKIVEIHAYCLMPNHFHFLLRQVQNGGITEFLSKISNSYTKYFNTKNQRVGPLLQGEFKSSFINSDEQLIHIGRYIHLNPIVAYLTNSLEGYEWSSYREYMGQVGGFCNIQKVLAFFRTPVEYHQFLLDQVNYGRQLEIMKHYGRQLEIMKHQLLD